MRAFRVFTPLLLAAVFASCATGPPVATRSPSPAFEAHSESPSPPVLRLSDGRRYLTVLGTIHAVPEEHADALSLPQLLNDEIEAADLVVVESNLLTLEHRDRLLQAMRVHHSYLRADRHEGRPSLSDFLKDRDETLLEEFSLALSERLAPLHERQLSSLLALRPWAARSNLNSLRRARDGIVWSPGVDAQVVRAARGAGIEVRYLESWRDLAALHDAAEQQSYVEELLFSVMGPVSEEAMARARRERLLETLESWGRGDLETAPGMLHDRLDVEVPPVVRASLEATQRMLLETRERRWVPRLLSFLEETEAKRIVVAVGAAHVVSEAAVFPDLLRDAGFKPVGAESLPYRR